MVIKFNLPKATHYERCIGWTLSYDFLSSIQKLAVERYNKDVSVEQVENVLLSLIYKIQHSEEIEQ